ncbi:Pectate lyase [Streptomyces alboniger]
MIVRNLTFESPLDCFPQWDPTDGERGAWNSEYDSAVVYGSTHVWLDHNTFTDGAHPDSSLPSYYGELYQRHDGELDVVRGADLVTVSWNVFADHDKTLMIGNSDSAGATDRAAPRHAPPQPVQEHRRACTAGALRQGRRLQQPLRRPARGLPVLLRDRRRVAARRAGQLVPAAERVGAGRVLKKWKEAPVTAGHNHVNGRPVDLIAAHNAEFPEETLQSGAGWTPHLRTRVDHPRTLPHLVGHRAGAGKLR